MIKFMCFAAGAAGGGLLAAYENAYPGWMATHPWQLVVGCIGLIAISMLVVQHHMNGAIAASARREESFRLAMLAQFAPEEFDREMGLAPAQPQPLALAPAPLAAVPALQQ